jgi:hypothetical protein
MVEEAWESTGVVVVVVVVLVAGITELDVGVSAEVTGVEAGLATPEVGSSVDTVGATGTMGPDEAAELIRLLGSLTNRLGAPTLVPLELDTEMPTITTSSTIPTFDKAPNGNDGPGSLIAKSSSGTTRGAASFDPDCPLRPFAPIHLSSTRGGDYLTALSGWRPSCLRSESAEPAESSAVNPLWHGRSLSLSWKANHSV